jgi:hypothetical protein
VPGQLEAPHCLPVHSAVQVQTPELHTYGAAQLPQLDAQPDEPHTRLAQALVVLQRQMVAVAKPVAASLETQSSSRAHVPQLAPHMLVPQVWPAFKQRLLRQTQEVPPQEEVVALQVPHVPPQPSGPQVFPAQSRRQHVLASEQTRLGWVELAQVGQTGSSVRQGEEMFLSGQESQQTPP